MAGFFLFAPNTATAWHYGTLPPLSPIPLNAVVAQCSFQTTLSGLSFCSRRRMSLCSQGSLLSQMSGSEASRSDTSSWCLGRGPLHMALARGSPLSIVQEMLSLAGPDKSIARVRDTDGLTPLHLALKRKAPTEDAVRAVLAFDPEVATWQDHFGRTPCKLWLMHFT